ncbi:MAG: hypothetical protein KC431_03295, partial [Myxococcales bacterium]|nr:hypothetical protein [Myxococcales bacterium]
MPTGVTFYVGSTVFLVMGGLTALALTGAVFRALAMLVSTTGWLMRALSRWYRPVGLIEDPDRPFSVDGLSAPLASLARETRSLALELRRRSEAARHWPEDGSEAPGVWRSFFLAVDDFTPLMDTRREVYDWLHSVDALGIRDRAELEQLGIDPEQVRQVLVESLLTSRVPADGVRALAGLMWTIDERLAGGTAGGGYRSNGFRAQELQSGGPARSGSFAGPYCVNGGADEEDEHAARERQLAAVMREHGTAISRMAGSYGRNRSERE